MQITDTDRWKFIKEYFSDFRGDVLIYDDYSINIIPRSPDKPQTGGKDLESWVDREIRKLQKKHNADLV